MHIAVSHDPSSRAADIALFGEGPGAYVMIDILRASTVLCTALHNGAEEIIPVADVSAARSMKKADPEALLCGEREGKKLEGFDLGNSPLEYTSDVVAGHRLIFASTNGSAALAAAPRDCDTFVGGFVNLSAIADRLIEQNCPTLLVCAGKLGHYALEDAVGAGALIAALWERDPDLELVNDAARSAQILWDHHRSDPVMPLWQCEHGKYLISLGFGADLSVCGAVDSVPVVPVLRDGRLVQ